MATDDLYRTCPRCTRLEHRDEPRCRTCGAPMTTERIELISTTDPHTRLRPGTRGTVISIDALGTAHVRWDDGGTLGLVPGEDRWRTVPHVYKADTDRCACGGEWVAFEDADPFTYGCEVAGPPDQPHDEYGRRIYEDLHEPPT